METHPGRWYIYKPTMAARGEDIQLFQNLSQLTDEQLKKFSVIQEYMTDNLLYHNHKFDLRVFILVTSVDPFIVYLYDEGIGRFASSEYVAPNATNYLDKHVHLTNFAVNK